MERLNDEIKQKEELLQEEKMERAKAEVELGREKDCNRVSTSMSLHTDNCFGYEVIKHCSAYIYIYMVFSISIQATYNAIINKANINSVFLYNYVELL